jgi:hypothetical protein
MPQIKLLSTDGPADDRFCFLSVFEFGFLMKLIASRKTKLGSQFGTYFDAMWEISGAWGEIPLSKF